MVSLYFGLPRAGKTTLLIKLAIKNRKKYKHIFANIHTTLDFVTYISNEQIGHYDTSDALLLIDEGTLFADSRDYKKFSKELIAFFMLHGHYRCDIIIFTQQWDGIDKKIRVITDKVYYVYKPKVLGAVLSRYYRIPYGIIIPDPKKDDAEKLGEIVQGYCKPPLLQRVFCGILWRSRYYKYFDSWEAPPLPPLPSAPEVV